MTRALLLIMLATTIASAQPDLPANWSPHGGWDSDFDRTSREMQQDFERRSAEHRRSFEHESKRMDEEFDRDSKKMMIVFGAFAVGILGVAGLAALAKRRRLNTDGIEYAPPAMAAPSIRVLAEPAGVDVSVLRIAIDGRASKFVQTELATITKSFDGVSAEGRATRLREVSVMLRRVRDAWVYGGAVNDPVRSRNEALVAAARHVDDARMRFDHDIAPAAPSGKPPQSLILVSIIVAARGELATVSTIGAGEDLRRALEAAAHRLSDDLLLVEIVWQPTEPGRQLSSLDLEQRFPPPELLPLHGAMIGKLFCTYCGGPFPGELITCPHCGAPAPGRHNAAV